MYYDFKGGSPLGPILRNTCYYGKNKNDFRMEIEGNGRVNAIPDIAIVTLGVETEERDLTTAQKENAVISANVIDSLKEAGVSEQDIQTVTYQIEPQYDFVDGKRIFRSYKVINQFQVTIRQIGNTGQIIDDAVESGANIVTNIRFSLSQPSVYYNKALSNAMKNAVEKAIDFEKTINISVNKIPVKIIEERYEYIPRDERFFAAPITTPIEAGDIIIRAKIRAVFTYCPNMN